MPKQKEFDKGWRGKVRIRRQEYLASEQKLDPGGSVEDGVFISQQYKWMMVIE